MNTDKPKIICSAMNCHNLADRNVAGVPFCTIHVFKIKQRATV